MCPAPCGTQRKELAFASAAVPETEELAAEKQRTEALRAEMAALKDGSKRQREESQRQTEDLLKEVRELRAALEAKTTQQDVSVNTPVQPQLPPGLITTPTAMSSSSSSPPSVVSLSPSSLCPLSQQH